jgi:hypothetical protein
MTDKITLKALCNELNVEPRVAREKLRTAVRDSKDHPNLVKAHKPRLPWEWAKGSAAEKEARAVLGSK